MSTYVLIFFVLLIACLWAAGWVAAFAVSHILRKNGLSAQVGFVGFLTLDHIRVTLPRASWMHLGS